MPDGEDPNGLVQGTDGNFYGTTPMAARSTIVWILAAAQFFKITPPGILTTLYTFRKQWNERYQTVGGGHEDRDGDFYGTTSRAGGSVCG